MFFAHARKTHTKIKHSFNNNKLYQSQFFNRNLFVRRHLDTSSDRLLIKFFSSACKIATFSARQTWHVLEPTLVATLSLYRVFPTNWQAFPPHHRLHKIINRNSIKLSYSCMPNIGDIIMHNKAILHQTDRKTQTVHKLCNCTNPNTCPPEGICKEGPIMYKATLTLQNKSIVYYGSCETEFKSRYSNHKQSFKFENKKHVRKLLKAIWNVKDVGETPLIE